MIRAVRSAATTTRAGDSTAGGSGSVKKGRIPAPRNGAARTSRRRRARASSPLRPVGDARRDVPTLEVRKAPARAAVLIPPHKSALRRAVSNPQSRDAADRSRAATARAEAEAAAGDPRDSAEAAAEAEAEASPGAEAAAVAG